MKKNKFKILLKKNLNYIIFFSLNNLIFHSRNIIILGIIMTINLLILEQISSIVAFKQISFK